MSREIVFRAWDGQQMRVPGIFCNITGKVYEDWREFEDGREIKDAILMQFTGLKDKNGVEIYEGDIVETSDLDKRLVVYNEHGFEMRLINGDKDGSMVWWFVIEVVGNIHENRELLNT